MSIKTKFSCYAVTNFKSEKTIILFPVSTDSEENKSFCKHMLPSGKLEMRIEDDTNASNYFKPGKEYYLTFEECI